MVLEVQGDRLLEAVDDDVIVVIDPWSDHEHQIDLSSTGPAARKGDDGPPSKWRRAAMTRALPPAPPERQPHALHSTARSAQRLVLAGYLFMIGSGVHVFDIFDGDKEASANSCTGPATSPSSRKSSSLPSCSLAIGLPRSRRLSPASRWRSASLPHTGYRHGARSAIPSCPTARAYCRTSLRSSRSRERSRSPSPA
jgi:hypothetical protein